MGELLSLNGLDLAAKLGPTGGLLLVLAFLFRWAGDRMFKRVEGREARADKANDNLMDSYETRLNAQDAFIQAMESRFASIESRLNECHEQHETTQRMLIKERESHADCARRLGAAEASIATLKAQAGIAGAIRQGAQLATAANRLAIMEDTKDD